jgi:valyl-tRNA synthetase
VAHCLSGGGLDDGERLVVATTRPETLLGDTAVAVHPEDPRFAHLIGQRLALPLTDRTVPVIADAVLVSMEFGTGAVKVTPGHDLNDFETGLRHGLEQISVFDLKGLLNENAPKRFQGLTIAQARTGGARGAAGRGAAGRRKAHKLSLGRCQRCDTVIEPTLSLQWFVKTEPLAKDAIEAVEQGKTKLCPRALDRRLLPLDAQHPRLVYQPAAVVGTSDSRPGTCPQGAGEVAGKVFVARTFEEACSASGPHGPFARRRRAGYLVLARRCGRFRRLGWPDQTRDLKTFYPTAVMETGHDILFFWVARMMMFGLHFMKKVPFRTVMLHALVVDENGEKMSKVKGNVIDPLHLVHGATMPKRSSGFPKDKQPSKKDLDEALAKFKKAFPSAAAAYPTGFPRQGADALRFFLLVMGAQGRNIRLSVPRIDGYRHFMNKIWSAVRFFLMNVQDSEFRLRWRASASAAAPARACSRSRADRGAARSSWDLVTATSCRGCRR